MPYDTIDDFAVVLPLLDAVQDRVYVSKNGELDMFAEIELVWDDVQAIRTVVLSV